MAIERSTKRIVDIKADNDDQEEQVLEKSLRPTSFSEYIGQERLKTNLKLAIDAVKKRADDSRPTSLYRNLPTTARLFSTIGKTKSRANEKTTKTSRVTRPSNAKSRK